MAALSWRPGEIHTSSFVYCSAIRRIAYFHTDGVMIDLDLSASNPWPPELTKRSSVARGPQNGGRVASLPSFRKIYQCLN
jgi:hypothetical protein